LQQQEEDEDAKEMKLLMSITDKDLDELVAKSQSHSDDLLLNDEGMS